MKKILLVICFMFTSCITQQPEKVNYSRRPLTTSQKIVGCIKEFKWEEADFLDKVESCIKIYSKQVKESIRVKKEEFKKNEVL